MRKVLMVAVSAIGMAGCTASPEMGEGAQGLMKSYSSGAAQPQIALRDRHLGDLELSRSGVVQPQIALGDMISVERSAGCAQPMVGFYSRIGVDGDLTFREGNAALPSAAGQMKESFFKRFLWLENQTVTFVAKVGVRPDVDAVAQQLILLAHADNDGKNGQTLNTELVVADPVLTPYFLVKPETVVDITFSAKQQKVLNSGLVRMLARVTQQATTALAPQSTLATALVKPVISTQAANADKWMDLMAGFQDSESLTVSTAPEEVKEYGELKFTGWLHPDRDKENWLKAAGWVIKWEDPRVSMFSTKAVSCDTSDVAAAVKAAGKDIDPSQVLKFEVVKGKTIQDLITGASWYRDAYAKIASPKIAGDKKAGISRFCTEIPGMMRAQNFNSYDASAILWAALIDATGADPLKEAAVPACQRYRDDMVDLGLDNNLKAPGAH